MRIDISEEAAEIIRKRKPENAKLVLNLNDGAGMFSDVAGSCSLDLLFDVVFANQDAELGEYAAEIESNLGTIFAKPYSLKYLDEGNYLRVSSMGMLVLGGAYSGMISGNVLLKDKTMILK
ncbi:hypothetical protein MFLO_10823 [Listeria floridensis FSL S10-1187]|uniref:Core domain-containing protein n=1 Tax=Listeria floridensis FSL S10-1187 TaxID=1265817 RepID=A0ABN0RDY4_9LIST|nr:iron-sulfur cluster biosynthesis family protein [Listeria floridensis]EUJ30310.1 hypothetical protein MFLO_10823 [Listeria floridensis FSL S10-1187]